MPEAATETSRLNVFISYSRDDLEFADQLDTALDGTGFNATIDRHSISSADEWSRALKELIQEADAVVFVLSPSSTRSKDCAWEVEEATNSGKRIIPVLCRPLDGMAPPPRLADLNYIYFYAEPKVPGSGFGSGLVKLIAALNEDPVWLREHTRLLGLATQWQTAGRPVSRLLSGDDISKAKYWLTERRQTKIEPTNLHVDFIRASEDEANARQSDARHQLAERERLLHEAEAGLKRAADAEHARSRSRRMTAWGAVAAIGFITVGIAVFAAQQASNAARQTALAIAARTAEAETSKSRDEALLFQSKHMTDLSQQQLKGEKDAGTAMLLALEALPDTASADTLTRTRPTWAPAEMTLEAARRQVRELAILKGHAFAVYSVAISPDGARIVTGDAHMARVWDAKTFAELATLNEGFEVTSVAVSPSGDRIFTISGDGVLRVWNATSFVELAAVKSSSAAISSVAASPDGARIVTGDGYMARVWDAKTFAELAALKVQGVTSVAFSPDGTHIVTGSADGTIQAWSTTSFAELAAAKIPGGAIFSVAVSPDGTRIIAGADDGVTRVLDATTFVELTKLKGDGSRIWSMSVSADGTRIVTSSSYTARVWDAKTFVELATLERFPLDVNQNSYRGFPPARKSDSDSTDGCGVGGSRWRRDIRRT